MKDRSHKLFGRVWRPTEGHQGPYRGTANRLSPRGALFDNRAAQHGRMGYRLSRRAAWALTVRDTVRISYRVHGRNGSRHHGRVSVRTPARTPEFDVSAVSMVWFGLERDRSPPRNGLLSGRFALAPSCAVERLTLYVLVTYWNMPPLKRRSLHAINGGRYYRDFAPPYAARRGSQSVPTCSMAPLRGGECKKPRPQTSWTSHYSKPAS